MPLTKNNLTNLSLNLVRLVRMVLGGLPHGLGFPLGVTISTDESCNGDGGSPALPDENTGEACTV